VPDERRQNIRSTMDALELLDHHGPELGRFLGREVRQPPVFGVPPHRLVRIRLGGVARQLLGDDLGVLRQVGRTTFERSWIFPLSRRIVIGPGMCRFSCFRNATVSSPWALAWSGSRWKSSPSRLRFGLTVMQLTAEMRS